MDTATTSVTLKIFFSIDVKDNPFIKNRSSTRITNAPGGNSSLSFGNCKKDKTSQSERIMPAHVCGSVHENSITAPLMNVNDEKEKMRNRNVHTDPKKNENTEAAGNLETGKMPAQSDRKTNVKVNQPPGGASSSIKENKTNKCLLHMIVLVST
ncbi:conserved Plasmodium protein, unknown function [Plasmodium ovale curtisi]|uniref:Uncharacterized protein n=1 Tax=Plasmodium ovale curtisi TaxID=864141 RepID=A0A1A8VR68_PLAOA|nr:conserved Plasmodium protein, unknown function [Plasmodium ovale curtisi]